MLKDDSRLKVDESRLKQTCDVCQRTIKPQGRKSLTGWILNWSHCDCKAIDDDAVDNTDPDAVDSAVLNTTEGHPAIAIKEEELPELPARYEAIARAGSGGMGSVLKVRDKDLDKVFAIKLLQKELANNAANRKRFEQEAEAAAKLDHENLVSVYGHGKTEDETPYLIMDYIEGESLAELLEREGRLAPEKALTIFSQIASALSHAHLNSVIHRDIKPTNIIISQNENGSQKARIVDFGIAKVLPDNSRETRDLTQTGEVFGSPQYMSPEQCLGFMLDQRSDIYSLGCLMYESLTGAPPFSGSNPIQLVVKHINDDIAPFPKELKSSKLMQNLERIVMHCLEKEQTARFQTMDELIHDFELVTANKQIPKYHIGVRAKPTLTRRQTIGAFALTFLVLFYASVGGSAFNSDLTQRGLPLLLLIICGGGIYVFLPAGLHLLQKVIRQGTPRQWWLAFTQTFIGLVGLTFTPFLVKQMFYTYKEAPYWYNDIALVAGVSQFVFSLLAIVCAIGYFLPSTDKKVKLPYIALNGSIMALALVTFVTFCFPKQIAPYPIWLAKKASLNHPEYAIPLYYLAGSLDKNQIHDQIPQLLNRLGRYKEALKSYEAIQKERLNSFHEFDIFKLNLKLGNFDEALKWLQNKPQNSYYFATYLAAKGQHEEALKHWFNTTNSEFNQNGVKGAIGSLCALGRYEEAIDYTNRHISKNSRLGPIECSLTQAIIYEQAGRTKEARDMFEKVLLSKSGREYFDPFTSLYLAYASHRLGYEDWYQSYLREAAAGGRHPHHLLEMLGLEYSGIKARW